jgi:hypothetical protein
MAIKLEINANVTGAAQVDKLNASLNKIGSSTSVADRALKTFNNSAERGRQTIENFGNAVKIAAAAGFGLAVYEAQKFVKSIIAVGQETQTFKTRLESSFSTVAEGARAFGYINQYAQKTPYSISQISNAFNDLRAISNTPAELATNLEIAGRIAAKYQIPFEEAADGLNKALTGGIESSRRFKDLNIQNVLGLQKGVEVPLYQVREAFQNTFGNGGRLSGSVDVFKNTLSGQIAQIENSFNKVKQAAGAVVIEGLTRQVTRLQKEFGGTNQSLEEFGVLIGTKIVEASLKLEQGIRFLVDNFDKLVALVQIFVAIKVSTAFIDIASAVISFGGSIIEATKLLKLFNIVWALGPVGQVGIVLAAIGSIIAIWIKWSDEIKKFIEYISKGLDVSKEFINKWSKTLIGKTIFKDINDEAKKAEKSIESVGETIDEALGGTQSFKIKDPTKEINDVLKNIQLDPVEIQIKPQTIPSDTITRSAEDLPKVLTASEERAKRLRETFDLLNLNSKQIGDTISDAWLQGMREGGTLMERLVNLSKSLLNTIIEQITRQTIQIGVEKVFDALSQKRQEANKNISKGITEQISLTQILTNVSSFASDAWGAIKDGVSGTIDLVSDLVGAIGKIITKLFAQLFVEKAITAEKEAQAATEGGSGGSSLFGTVGKIFGFADGGVVPGGAPYTDRVPALLTPGETIIPRGESGVGGGQMYTTYITQNLNTNDLQSALLSAIRTNAETVNQILQSEKNK